ncbi:MAG TPA: transaldolase [Anaerolineales bacterium]|nr:transaldolase [Anaerolineales bacterium]
MVNNPLRKLQALGQSIWIDFIRRETTTSGELQQLIEQDGVSGVTSNPSIFEKAIAEGHEYESAIQRLISEGKTVDEIYRRLTVEDIQMVADVLRPVYDRTAGGDGFVSLEVSPGLANDTAGTIEEARRLWSLVDRSNVMIKVPATQQGLPAIWQLTGEGINVNITLLFGLPRYREVADSYITGLETLASSGGDLKQVASVASFFLSRIDVLLDPLLEEKSQAGGPTAALARRLQGQAAIASAKVAYQIYREIFESSRFKRLADQGAKPQKLLWASTSTKNPEYSDTKYIEPLIGPETINTLPVESLVAYRDHGDPQRSLVQHVPEAYQTLSNLSRMGIDLDAVTHQLEEEGIKKFVTAFDRLIALLQEKQKAAQEPLSK